MKWCEVILRRACCFVLLRKMMMCKSRWGRQQRNDKKKRRLRFVHELVINNKLKLCDKKCESPTEKNSIARYRNIVCVMTLSKSGFNHNFAFVSAFNIRLIPYVSNLLFQTHMFRMRQLCAEVRKKKKTRYTQHNSSNHCTISITTICFVFFSVYKTVCRIHKPHH